MKVAVLKTISAAIFGLVVAGCSIHPIPDDVSRYSTADIVWHIRCEAKGAVRRNIRELLVNAYEVVRDPAIEQPGGSIKPDEVLRPENLRKLVEIDRQIIRLREQGGIDSKLPPLAATFQNYAVSSIAYDFEFTITEDNAARGNALFRVPFASGGSLSLAVDGGLKKERNAVRKFRTVETFAKLAKLDCDGYEKPARNKLYPLTGSIGMARIMDTFIDISQIGGAEKTFADEITFTTTVGGGVRPTLVLNPIVGEFRPVLADLDVDTGRTDIHKVLISLSFPKEDLRDEVLSRAFLEEQGRLTSRRALLDLCIAREESREDAAGTLRLISPRAACQREFSDRRFSSGF